MTIMATLLLSLFQNRDAYDFTAGHSTSVHETEKKFVLLHPSHGLPTPKLLRLGNVQEKKIDLYVAGDWQLILVIIKCV